MKAELVFNGNMAVTGINERGQETHFDILPSAGGDSTAPTPMEVMVQSMAACSYMDVLSIIRKKRRHVSNLKMHVTAERETEHPRVFRMVHLIYELDSPDAECEDLNRAVELSQSKYCGASAMFKAAGCIVTWDCKLLRDGVEINSIISNNLEAL